MIGLVLNTISNKTSTKYLINCQLIQKYSAKLIFVPKAPMSFGFIC